MRSTDAINDEYLPILSVWAVSGPNASRVSMVLITYDEDDEVQFIEPIKHIFDSKGEESLDVTEAVEVEIEGDLVEINSSHSIISMLDFV